MKRWYLIILFLAAGALLAPAGAYAVSYPRIASTSPGFTATIIAMGLEDHLVAVSRFCTLPDRLADLPRVADAQNVDGETLLKTKPDVVLTQIKDPSRYASLTEIDPHVQVIYVSIERIGDIGASMLEIGEIVGKEADAQAFYAEWQERIAVFEADTPFATPPRVLQVTGTVRPDTSGANTFIGDMIALAGGTNVGAELLNKPWGQTDIDTIVKAQPDVILCQVFDPAEAQNTREYWLRWKEIPASRTGRVFVIDGSWTIPSPEILDRVGELREMLQAEGAPWQGRMWVVWRMRIFRWLAAAVVGAALAVGGMALQGMLRNPLAEPYLLGVSSGAGVGVLLGYAVSGWFVWAGWLALPMLAFVGATLTCGVVYMLAQRGGRIDSLSLILSGVIINCFNGAIMLVIYLYIDPLRIPDYIQWSMGRLPDMVPMGLLAVSAGLVAVGSLVLLFSAASMNVLTLGDTVAASSGVSVHRLRLVTFVCVGMMTAAAVAIAGPIGFLGLIVPHICRMIVGPDLRRGIIVSAVLGAGVLVGADMLCRFVGPVIGVGLIPVGIVTALTGGPFFIILLRRQRGGVL